MLAEAGARHLRFCDICDVDYDRMALPRKSMPQNDHRQLRTVDILAPGASYYFADLQEQPDGRAARSTLAITSSERS
jgi:hypothetical protein